MLFDLFLHNARMLIRTSKIWTMALMLHGIFLFIGYNIFQDTASLEAEKAGEALNLIFQGLALLAPLAVIAFLLNFCLYDLIIGEKNSRRLEYILGTGIRIRNIWLGAGLSIAFAIIVILLSLQVLLLLSLLVQGFSPGDFITLPFFVLWAVNLPLFTLFLTLLLTGLALIIRRNELITNILYISGFIIIFGGTYGVTNYMERVAAGGDIITGHLNLFVLGITFILLILTVLIRRGLDAEKTILSIPD